MASDNDVNEEAARAVDEITRRLTRKAMRSLGWLVPMTEEAVRLDEVGQRAGTFGPGPRDSYEAWPTVLRETPEPPADMRRRSPSLAAVPTTTSSKPTRSFAFMPFKDAGGESDAMTVLDPAECVAARFGAAGMGVVRPFSTSRMFTVLGDVSKAGRWMEVDYVFDGSIARTGSRLLATARLLRVSDSKLVWEKTCEGNEDDLIAFENSVAEQVALIFQPHLTPEWRERFVKQPTDNAEAYLQYKLGRDRFNRFDEEGLNDAVDYFGRAATLDPNFADAHACLSETLVWLALLGLHSHERGPAQLFAESSRCAETALALNPSLANAQASKAFVKMCVEADWRAAARGFRLALECDPNYVLAHVGLACLLTGQGRFTQALAKIEAALTIDPNSFICHFIKGTILYEAREFARAARQFEDTLRIHKQLVKKFRNMSVTLPPPDTIFYGLALAYAALGFHKEAALAAKRATRYARGNPMKLALRAYVLAFAGRRDEAQTILERLLKERQEDFIPFHIALIHVALGERDKVTGGQHKDAALQHLRSARAKCDYWMFLLRVDPRLDSLRSELSFEALLHEANLSEAS